MLRFLCFGIRTEKLWLVVLLKMILHYSWKISYERRLTCRLLNIFGLVSQFREISKEKEEVVDFI